MTLVVIAAATTRPDSQWPAKVAVAALALIAGLFLLDRFFMWMERRGWIYWRKAKREPGTGGGAMAGFLTGFQKIIEPQIEHRQQVMEERNESIGQRTGRGDGTDDDDESVKERKT